MPTVEVQRNGDPHVWYVGYLKDVARNGNLLVGYDGNVWREEHLQASSVRIPARFDAEELQQFDPAEGTEVELRVESDHAPVAWRTAVVSQVLADKGLYYVTRRAAGSKDDGSTEIVEKTKLRPVRAVGTLSEQSLKEDRYALPDRLSTWSTTVDATGCFRHIEEVSGLVLIRVIKGELLLIGDDEALKRAKLMLEVHVKHQIQIQSFQEVREKRLKALEDRRNRLEGAGFKHSAEVVIEKEFIGRVIGTKGKAIAALEEKHDVSIRVMRESEETEDATIRIFAKTLESLEAARAEVEYIRHPVSVPPDQHDWVIGKGGKTIAEVKASAGLVYASLERDTAQLVLCGTRKAVDEAVAMVEAHLLYFPVFSQMDEEMETILQKLEELGDWDSRWKWPKSWSIQDYESYGYERKGAKGGKDGKGKWWDKGSKAAGKGSSESKGREDKGKSRGYADSSAWQAPVGKGSAPSGKSSKARRAEAWVDRRSSQDYYDEEGEDDEEEDEDEHEGKSGGRGGGKKSGRGRKGESKGKSNGAIGADPSKGVWAKGGGKSKGSGKKGRRAEEDGTEGADADSEQPPPQGSAAAARKRQGKKGPRLP